MNHAQIIRRLTKNGSVFRYLVENITNEQARWKPAENKWSILEVVNHLYDEEREDFRARIESTLNGTPWQPIDPEGWVTQRKYSERVLAPSLKNFLAERQKSIAWLNALKNPNWQASFSHPKLGAMTAEAFLANWQAHDLLHIRQINALHWEYLAQQVKPLTLEYAGRW